MKDLERIRLAEADRGTVGWRQWGPYLSERQWGTVREDYSSDEQAWSSFTHDQARSRAYRWGEDGLAGLSDDRQQICLALALWNGHDPILKERLFGLTNSEGNHGEDVKECYFYLDATPTYSYLKMLYKYPQGEFPYLDLVTTNAARGKDQPEYELLDTGAFRGGRYFDVFVEYAKRTAEDILMQITVANRGPEAAELHVLPTVWFRHTWSWAGGPSKPNLAAVGDLPRSAAIRLEHPALGSRWLYSDSAASVLVTENETNNRLIFGTSNDTEYVKDGIGRAVVDREGRAVNPDGIGTKAALHHQLLVPAGGAATIRLRFTNTAPVQPQPDRTAYLFQDFDEVMKSRREDAEDFWSDVMPQGISLEKAMVVRQSLAGLLWSMQYYCLDVERWLTEHGADPFAPNSSFRNHEWRHLLAEDVISMPDKWEYPWFAAWDLAFHAVAFAAFDVGMAKKQLDLLLDHRYLHPNGQLSAYEWNFGDVNPPVHAWATYFVYEIEKMRTGKGDRDFLERSFHKLTKNLVWWLNRKDLDGRNIFQGGFLGLDNIGVFDRSGPLPTGGYLDQADGTAWMALFTQNMMQIALELAGDDQRYLEHVQGLFENLAWIGAAMRHVGPDGISLWDEEDGFFYDVLRRPDGSAVPLKVRSVVGLMPLAAATVIPGSVRQDFPGLVGDILEFLSRHPVIMDSLPGHGRQLDETGPVLFGLFDEHRLREILSKMLDEEEFLGAHGIRSVSRWHKDHPYTFTVQGQDYTVRYLPAESDTGMFGGNSNWRGPVWFPMNLILLRALINIYVYVGDRFTVECPTGSGVHMNLYEVAAEIGHRLLRIFLPDEHGRRAVHGNQAIFADDPHWQDLLLFYEYFHGDTGAGVGASHQTGWTATAALVPLVFGRLDSLFLATRGLWPSAGDSEARRAVPA